MTGLDCVFCKGEQGTLLRFKEHMICSKCLGDLYPFFKTHLYVQKLGDIERELKATMKRFQ